MATFFAACAFVCLVLWWTRRRRIVSEDGVAAIRTGDADMERAMARARADFHLFVDRLRNPQAGDESFAIKAGIRHGGDVEHVWLTDVHVDDLGFEGEIANDPAVVPQRRGERWRGTNAELSDWTWFSNGLMQGNFTLRAMLPRMPKAQRRAAQAMLEQRWDTRELAHRPWPADAAMAGEPLSDALSPGDPTLMKGVEEHLRAHLGDLPEVFHERLSPSAHIDLYPFPATPRRPYHVVATTGMAEQPMRVPARSSADARVELLVVLPKEWPLDVGSWAEERHYWPLRWLKRVARFHYETGRWLGEGHVLTHGADPAPIDASATFDGVVLAPPHVLPPEAHRVVLADGREVRLLCLYFLDPASRAALEAHGWPAYARVLAERPHSV
jgi:uncharacterized protein YegJ (DUF2314 family)